MMRTLVSSPGRLVRLLVVGVAVFAVLTLSLRPSTLSLSPIYQQVTSLDLPLRLFQFDDKNITENVTVAGTTIASQVNISSLTYNLTSTAVLGRSVIGAESVVTTAYDNGREKEGKVTTSRQSFHRNLSLNSKMRGSRNRAPPVIDSPAFMTANYDNTTGDSGNGFLLSIEYPQQLLSGFLGYYHLSFLAKSLNLSMVEPFVHLTRIVGVPPLKARSSVTKLSYYYDYDQMQKALHHCTGVNLTTFENFLRKALRKVIIVDFVTVPVTYASFFNEETKIIEHSTDTESSRFALGRINDWISQYFHKSGVRRKINGLNNYVSFRRYRVFIVDARPLHPFSWKVLVEKVGSAVRELVTQFGSATVIIPKWRDIQSPGMISKYFYSVPDYPWHVCPELSVIPHTEAIMSATDVFTKTITGEGPVIGVHIRSERILVDYKGNISHYKWCLKQLKELLENGTVPNVAHDRIHVFHDLGRYGSISCKNFCVLGHEAALNATYSLGYKIMNFNPSILGSNVTSTRALPAFVDREYLSRADVLVTIGKGQHQQNIVDRFVKNSGGSTENLYRICHNRHPIPDCYPDNC